MSALFTKRINRKKKKQGSEERNEEKVKIYLVIMSKKDFKFKYLDKVSNQFRHANESFTITEISSSVSNFQKKKGTIEIGFK